MQRVVIDKTSLMPLMLPMQDENEEKTWAFLPHRLQLSNVAMTIHSLPHLVSLHRMLSQSRSKMLRLWFHRQLHPHRPDSPSQRNRRQFRSVLHRRLCRLPLKPQHPSLLRLLDLSHQDRGWVSSPSRGWSSALLSSPLHRLVLDHSHNPNPPKLSSSRIKYRLVYSKKLRIQILNGDES